MSEDTSAATPPATRVSTPGWLGSTPNRVLLGAGSLVVVVVFLFGSDSWLSILDYVLIYALGTLGLNVLSGYAGQISLGIAFFMGIGAYTAIALGGGPSAFPGAPAGLSLPFVLWLPAAGIVSALVGAAIGPTALRLKGFYLGIVTLALVIVGQYYLFPDLPALTGGPEGGPVPAPAFGSFSFATPSPIFGLQFSTNQLFFALMVVVLLLAGLFVANVGRTRVGRAWAAVRDNEVAASIMGVNLLTAKMGAFVLSSFLAGISGALLASFVSTTAPRDWSLVLSIQFIAAMLIGGVASVWGSILGAAFVFGLVQAIETFIPQSASSTIQGSYVVAVLYGLLIIAFLLFEPAGLIGLMRRAQVVIRRFEQTNEGGAGGSDSANLDTHSQLDTEITRLPRRTGPSLPGE